MTTYIPTICTYTHLYYFIISSPNRDPCVAIWYLDISRASHLDGLKWSCQQIAHKRILFKSSCNWTQSLSERTFSYRATSSCSKNLNRKILDDFLNIINIQQKSNGSKTELCRTPELTGNHWECEPFIITLWKRHVRKEQLHLRSIPDMPKASSLSNNLSWGTESNVLAKSRKSQWTKLWSSKHYTNHKQRWRDRHWRSFITKAKLIITKATRFLHNNRSESNRVVIWWQLFITFLKHRNSICFSPVTVILDCYWEVQPLVKL